MLSREYGEYVGLDVHKKMIQATVLNGIGEKMLAKRFGNNEIELEEFSSEIGGKAKKIIGVKEDFVAYYKHFKHRKESAKYLKVIVKYLNGEGYVISSYFVKDML